MSSFKIKCPKTITMEQVLMVKYFCVSCHLIYKKIQILVSVFNHTLLITEQMGEWNSNNLFCTIFNKLVIVEGN